MAIKLIPLETTADEFGNWAVSTEELGANSMVISGQVQIDGSLVADPRSSSITAQLRWTNASGPILANINMGAQYDMYAESGAATFPLPFRVAEGNVIFATGTGAVSNTDPPEGIPVAVYLSVEEPAP